MDTDAITFNSLASACEKAFPSLRLAAVPWPTLGATPEANSARLPIQLSRRRRGTCPGPLTPPNPAPSVFSQCLRLLLK